ncbi:MAG: hypothetical protein ACKO9F_06090 [Caldilinea sp.]
MVIRLSLAFGSTAEMWLRLQTAYDLAQTRVHADRMNILCGKLRPSLARRCAPCIPCSSAQPLPV